jgi:hypothetical protein
LKLSLDFPRRRTPIRDLLYRNRQNRDCRRIAKTRRCLRPIRIRIFRRASQSLSAQVCGIRSRTLEGNGIFLAFARPYIGAPERLFAALATP